MNKLIADSYVPAQGFFLPSRRISCGSNYSLKLADLAVLGVQVAGEVDELGYQRCMLPAGWRPVPTDESPMQLRLVDADNNVRAKIFYKPASQGATASMQIMPGFTPDVTLGH